MTPSKEDLHNNSGSELWRTMALSDLSRQSRIFRHSWPLNVHFDAGRKNACMVEESDDSSMVQERMPEAPCKGHCMQLRRPNQMLLARCRPLPDESIRQFAPEETCLPIAIQQVIQTSYGARASPRGSHAPCVKNVHHLLSGKGVYRPRDPAVKTLPRVFQVRRCKTPPA